MKKKKELKRPVSEYEDITQHEIHALTMDKNLADAHTHQSQSKSQAENIIANLPTIWYEAEDATQAEMEQKFLRDFFRVANQEEVMDGYPPMLVYASSIAMVIVANYFMKNKMSVALIEPCFDNLHDIMKHMQIPMQPLKEEWLNDPDKIYDNLKANITSDVIFIVDPNNPTGHTMFKHGDKAYLELIRYALDHDKLLVFDYCFAPFVDNSGEVPVPRVYKLLNESGVKYIAIEDTGKTWPLQDTKVAILKVCESLYKEVYSIHTAYLLNVSPFILNLVSAYICDSEKDKFESVYGLLRTNNKIARDILEGSALEYMAPDVSVSVAWYKIKDDLFTASELQEFVLNYSEVYILPGTYFFWSDRSQGESFIRIALARNSDVFTSSLKGLRAAVDELERIKKNN
jgi:aspartate/methionine/tyrosine aminotransferase